MRTKRTLDEGNNGIKEQGNKGARERRSKCIKEYRNKAIWENDIGEEGEEKDMGIRGYGNRGITE